MIEGSISPKVAKMPPNMPAFFVPTKVATLTATAPGVLSAMAKTSISSDFVRYLCLSTTSRSIIVNMA